MFTHPLGSLLVSGVQEFRMEDAVTHPWRVYWYQESRNFLRKMKSRNFLRKIPLLVHGEFTGIMSPEVSQGRYLYSSMESLLASGVQDFHM
jgi:hypothetical protein